LKKGGGEIDEEMKCLPLHLTVECSYFVLLELGFSKIFYKFTLKVTGS